MKKSNIIFVVILSLSFLLLVGIIGLIYLEVSKPTINRNSEDGEFSVNFIKKSDENIGNTNYMISPYSVEIALSMLRDGADGETYEEISSVVPERNIKSLSINKRVNVANGLFIKDKYKNNVSKDYINNLKNNYNASVYFDKFDTPKVINDWVNKETKGMIKSLTSQIDSQFVFGLVNAVAMDEEWAKTFESEKTYKGEFNLNNSKTMDVSMMHENFSDTVSYYKDADMESVVIPYAKYSNSGVKSDDGEQLEFIGILPNEDINSYISNLTLDKISLVDKKKIIASSDYEVRVSLPKFKFDYNFSKFKETLTDMGIRKVFTPSAELTKVIPDDGVYVNEAIHKSYVEVDEDGTKAAAVTGFLTKETAMATEEEYFEIVFNRPFIFIIKDVSSNEILFFGVVYEPSKYTSNK